MCQTLYIYFSTYLIIITTLEDNFIIICKCIITVVVVESNNDALNFSFKPLFTCCFLFLHRPGARSGSVPGPGPGTSTCPLTPNRTPCQVDALAAAAAPVMTGWKPPSGWCLGGALAPHHSQTLPEA